MGQKLRTVCEYISYFDPLVVLAAYIDCNMDQLRKQAVLQQHVVTLSGEVHIKLQHRLCGNVEI